jgi:branched-chain amino acid aminotransferase
MFDSIEWQPERREKYIVNGALCDASGLPHAAHNRAFQYGDGFFETIRVCNGVPQHVELHWNRVEKSLEAHRIEKPANWEIHSWETALESLCQANSVDAGGRLRVSFFRVAGGRYTPQTNALEWIAEVEPLDSNTYTLNENGLAVDVYPDMKKLNGPLANFKNTSAMLYVQASLWAREKELDDALITNTSHSIIESTRSNLFLVSNRVLYTPGLESGPIGGVMRAAVINLALEEGFKVYECNISPGEMLRADELFLTNAVRGIQWVASYRTKRYFNMTSKSLIESLNSRLIA